MNNLSYERKKKITIIAIATIIAVLGILLAIVLATNSENEVPASAEGDTRTHQTTVPDGYIGIYNANDLTSISSDSSNLTKNYILMEDINISGIDFVPIGDSATPFKGIFDGNNHTISNLYIESDNQYVGLFGYTNGGTIENLTIENATVKGVYTSATYVGILAGYTTGGTIENVSITGTSTATCTTGTSTKYIGGLVGYVNSGTTNTSNSNANVTVENGTISAGGLVGYIGAGTIQQSYATGNVEAISTSGQISAGGLVGHANISSASTAIVVRNAYATGDVTANTSNTINTGGLIGYARGYSTSRLVTVTNTYAVGKVEVLGTGTKNIGGLIGYASYYRVTSSYWSPETTGQLISTKGTPKLFNSMLKQDTYEGWEFDTIWVIDEGETLPYLVGMNKPEKVKATNYEYIKYDGAGTEENPYIITTEAQLRGIKYDLDLYYILGNDVILTEAFEPIGDSTTPFKGTLDGGENKYTIKNVTIDTEGQYAGMFGYISGGAIKNLNIENIIVTNSYNAANNGYIGTIVGYVDGSSEINNVSIIGESKVEYAEGTGPKYIGGLVGYSLGKITGSSTTANVICTLESGVSQMRVGGLVGLLSGTVTGSYATGDVSATSTSGIYIGGLVGEISSAGTITGSYETGNVSATSTLGIYIGGLVGRSTSTQIEKSYATGNVTAESKTGAIEAGGLIGEIGYNDLTLEVAETYATGDVTANSETGAIYIGGLVGYASRSNPTTSSDAGKSININNSYTMSNLEANTTATISVGGAIGYARVGHKLNYQVNAVSLMNIYAVGEINVSKSATTYTGGLIGYVVDSPAISNSYWASEVSNQYVDIGYITEINWNTSGQRALRNMLHKSSYKNWDFDTIWTIKEGETLPYLRYMNNPQELNREGYIEYEGEGTAESPYIIRTEKQLQGIINEVDAHYIIAQDITLTKNFEPIGNTRKPFTGTLDGNGHTINNLNIESSEQYVGMFRNVAESGKGGVIKNIILNNATVKSTYQGEGIAYVGSLVGKISEYSTSEVTIDKVSVTGVSKVECTSEVTLKHIGGLIGDSELANISNSGSNADVIAEGGQIRAGGLIGEGRGNVARTYATGNVIATSKSEVVYAGGLVR